MQSNGLCENSCSQQLTELTQSCSRDTPLMLPEDNKYDVNLRLIDCRWDYEFQGGAIQGAVNINDAMKLLDYMFS